jgi:UDP-N-acetylglucosamine 2-epimerase (non-hydrolysing)
VRLALVAGARPNFMKIAPLIDELRRRGHTGWFLVHTGQHYDAGMSGIFFDELGLPEPDVWLGVGSGTQAQQTAAIMTTLEPVFVERAPDWAIVVGDVNSTMAAALVAAKLGIRIAHVEAGLRSGDRSMPEEINRLVTDAIADCLLAPSEDAVDHLRKEGIPEAKIHMVGNIMVDSLLKHLPSADWRRVLGDLRLLGAGGEPVPYAVLTLHRPSNVDNAATFDDIMRGVAAIAAARPVVFPVHPRAKPRVDGLRIPGLRAIDPLGYLDFLALMSRASLVMTDSGGLQEETTVMGVPCFTLRSTTERPVTITHGTNVLVGPSGAALRDAVSALPAGGARPAPKAPPPLWDGRTAHRIIDVLERL